ncbi:MAG: sialate O-acetylesterase [Planctomycetaceae bacterium]|nr:MAG: sialate O-acetylesterase [Planctomycetaceae bacterium]
MRTLITLICLSLACVGLPSRTRAQSTAGPTNLDLYLLIGQSNMAGRGKPVPSDQTPHPRVFALDAAGNWVPATDPLHFDKPAAVGVGLGLTFGIEIAAANPDATIGLIPCAVGGSPIDAWTPGTHYPPTNSHPWDDAIRRARQAMRNGTLRGILWHQGESDSSPGLAEAYQAKLDDLIARLRKELEADEAPFLVGQLGQFPERPWNDSKNLVDRTLRELPQRVPKTAFVSSDDLTHGGDQVHFDADSYREFGRRYAAAYRELLAP